MKFLTRSIAFLSLTSLLFVASGCGGGEVVSDETADQNTPVAETQEVYATVEVEEAGVSLKKKGETDFTPISGMVRVVEGDVVKTDEKGLASITYVDDSVTRMDVSTEVKIALLDFDEDEGAFGAADTKIGLAKGHIWNNVRKLTDEGSSFEVETPTTVAAVRGTKFDVWYELEKKVTWYVAAEHDIQIDQLDENKKKVKNMIVKEGKNIAFWDKAPEKMKAGEAMTWHEEYEPMPNHLKWVKEMEEDDEEYAKEVFKKNKERVEALMKEVAEKSARMEEILEDEEEAEKVMKQQQAQLYFLQTRAEPEMVSAFLQEHETEMKSWLKNPEVKSELKAILQETENVIFENPDYLELKQAYPEASEEIMNELKRITLVKAVETLVEEKETKTKDEETKEKDDDDNQEDYENDLRKKKQAMLMEVFSEAVNSGEYELIKKVVDTYGDDYKSLGTGTDKSNIDELDMLWLKALRFITDYEETEHQKQKEAEKAEAERKAAETEVAETPETPQPTPAEETPDYKTLARTMLEKITPVVNSEDQAKNKAFLAEHSDKIKKILANYPMSQLSQAYKSAQEIASGKLAEARGLAEDYVATLNSMIYSEQMDALMNYMKEYESKMEALTQKFDLPELEKALADARRNVEAHKAYLKEKAAEEANNANESEIKITDPNSLSGSEITPSGETAPASELSISAETTDSNTYAEMIEQPITTTPTLNLELAQ